MTIIFDKEVALSIVKIKKHYGWSLIFDKEMFDDVCEVQVSLLYAGPVDAEKNGFVYMWDNQIP